MRVATITKRFTFHAAHRLPNHAGLCRDLHGHTYVLEVAVTGRVNGGTGRSDEGMVLDFTELKDVYKARIYPLVEHTFLNETLDIITTSENIAGWIWSVFNEYIQEQSQLRGSLPAPSVQVRLWETPTSYAEVGPTPWRSA